MTFLCAGLSMNRRVHIAVGGLIVAAALIFMIVRLLEGQDYLAESSVLVFVIVAGGVLLTYGAWKKDE